MENNIQRCLTKNCFCNLYPDQCVDTHFANARYNLSQLAKQKSYIKDEYQRISSELAQYKKDDRLGCVKSPTKTKKDPIAEKYVSEAIQALPYWLEEVRRLNKALELVLSVNADDGCPGCSFSPKFEGWQECNNCPANYEETDYDTNLAYWKRYYLEKAAEVQNG